SALAPAHARERRDDHERKRDGRDDELRECDVGGLEDDEQCDEPQPEEAVEHRLPQHVARERNGEPSRRNEYERGDLNADHSSRTPLAIRRAVACPTTEPSTSSNAATTSASSPGCVSASFTTTAAAMRKAGTVAAAPA